MDTAIETNGDFAKDTNGAAYSIFGIDEIKQKIYILLSARLGEFIYDRNLGSKIYNIDLSLPTAKNDIIAQARKTLCSIPEVEVTGAEISGEDVTVQVKIEQQVYNIELRL